LTPGVSIGTNIIDWRLCALAFSGSVCPMKMRILQVLLVI
jgi:hypothetical protein